MRRIGKKAITFLLVASMTLTMTGCGKSKKNSEETQKEKNEARKEMVFKQEDFEISGYEGDISTFVACGDKLYFSTYQWIEGEGNSNDTESEDGTTETADDADKTDAEDGTTEAADDADKTDAEDGTTEAADDADKAESEDATTEAADDTDDVVISEEALDEGYTVETVGYDGYSITKFYSCNLDGSNVQEIKIPDMSQDEYADRMLVDNDGNLVLVISCYDAKSDAMQYSLLMIDKQGKASDKVNITKELNLGTESYINSYVLDNEGRLSVIMEQQIIVLDSSFKKIAEIKSENWISAGTVTKDGKLICGMSDDNSAFVQEVDIENKKFTERHNLDIPYFPSSESLIRGNGNYDFFYSDESGIYGYVMADEKSTKLMDYVASDLDSEHSWGITPISEDLMIGTQWSDIRYSLVKYVKVDPSEIVDKEIITCGAIYMDDNVRRAAVEFNKKSDKYRIEFKDYSSSGEDAETKMNADIVAGNIPDILCLNNLPVEQYISKGILEDLNPYFEKDESISTDDLVPALYKAMLNDGKLYYVTTGFNINTLIASKKAVGDVNGWTFGEMKDFLDKQGEKSRPFYSSNKMDMFYYFIASSINDYIDWSTGKCSFDSEDFRSLLEICNEKGVNEEFEYNEDSPSLPTLVKEGTVLFNESWITLEEIQLYKAMYGGDVAFVGYPNEARQGSAFTLDSPIGIYSKSDYKEGAWEFISTFLSKEYQGKGGYFYNCPSRQDCFDMMVRTRTATEKYTDEFGNEIMPYESSWGYDGLEVAIHPSSEEDVKVFKEVLNNTTRIGFYDYALIEMVQDEAKAYFNGDKNLDETVKIIQNRMTTYVNENR